MMHSAATGRIDKRTLTNEQRAAMGLPLRGRKGGHGNTGPRYARAAPIVKTHDTSPAERLVKMLTEQVRRFDCLVAEDRRIQPL
jgi:hypothetical protein